ncbi:hypothetical protein VP1G_03201 [Cytospora mali]|uniref:Accumulation-associated protein n=1 Tax=Cytospora mali TaxID=578113 RepID=A0A194UVV7_CYTMA|nr:hypothetical protein VP1G_03201 [Valsa mali var. pyri (nom. inval.)]
MASPDSPRPDMPHSQTTKGTSRPSTRASQLDVPDTPPRPSSAPPSSNPGNISAPASPASSPALQHAMGNLDLSGHDTDQLVQDEKTSSFASRFVGNMLISRIGRASWQSLESTARLPFYFSPWGDNTPFTLPNLRKRDLALAGLAHLGLDALADSTVTVVESAVEHAVSATVEQTVDEGMGKVTGRYSKPHKVVRKVGLDSLTLRIKHKLIGEAAELVFRGERDTADWVACAKAWFCPYLYASGREPEITRAKDFTMAQLLRPRLAADAVIAPTLLASLGESHTPIVSPFDSKDQNYGLAATTYPKFRRMAIVLTGISPYRFITSLSAWSHSRIPNEARITFHLFTHIPAIIFPVRDKSPILAWSPWTVAQMLEKKTKYDMETHVKELLDFIESTIDEEVIQDVQNWQEPVACSLRTMLSPVLDFPDEIRETAKECCELERTGLVFFRY